MESKAIDQYVYLIGKSSNHSEVASIVLRTLADPNVFVYGEILALPAVQVGCAHM